MSKKYLSLGLAVGILCATYAAPAAEAIAPPEAPVTESATNVTSSSVLLRGTLNPGSSAEVGWYFAFGDEGSCSEAFSTELQPELVAQKLEVSTEESFLLPSTTYTYCLVATNEGGETPGPPVSFTTLGVTPLIESESVSAITGHDAALSAEIAPRNQAATDGFEYATNPAFEGATVVAGGEIPAEFGSASVGPVDLGGLLQPGTTYYYRAFAENATGTAHGEPASFKTIGFPVATDLGAEATTRTTAQLSATVSPGGGVTSLSYVYIDEASYDAAVAAGDPNPFENGASTEVDLVEASNGEITPAPLEARELRPGTTYRFAAVTANSAGTILTPGGAFTTAVPTPPSVATGGAAEVGSTTAVVAGAVDTHDLTTTYFFELEAPGGSFSSQGSHPLEAGFEAGAVSGVLENLSPGQAYAYRLCATNSDGVVCGAVESFITSPVLFQLPTAPAFQFLSSMTPPGALAKIVPPPQTSHPSLRALLRACRHKAKQKRKQCERNARRRFRKR